MYWDPFEEMRRFRREMDRALGSIWSGGEGPMDKMRIPLMDIEERKDDVVLVFDLPGVEKEDIELNVTEDEVELSVESEKEDEEKRKEFYRAERSYTGFYRKSSLPCEVVPERARADYHEGVLEVRIPKKEKAKKKKRTRVKIE